MGDCSLKIAKFVVSATFVVYKKQPMSKQSIERHTYIALVCYDKLNTKQGN